MNRVATGLGGVAAALLAVGVVNGETPPPSGVSLDDAAPSAPSLQPGISAQDVARAARQPGGAAGVRFHSVRAGDTLSRIAETHGFTIEQIAIANGISPAGVLSPGDIIYLPEKLGAAPATPEAAPLRRPTARSSQHVIVPNDTLYSIGRRYGFTVEELTDANAITADTPLAIGDTLLLPTITGAIPTAGPSVRPASGDVSGAGDAVTEPQLRGTLTNPQDMQPAARAEAGAVAATGTDERPAQERSGLRRFSYDPDAPAAGSSSAATPDGLFDISLRGRVRAAYGYNDEDLQLADADLEPTVRVDLPGDWRFSVTGRFRADAEDNIEPGRPAQLTRSSANKRALLGDRAEIELREAYIQGDLLDIDWTIGKQQIVWGESDGFKVLDVVNPQSFREFILPEFDESRIPLWSARAEKVIGQTTFEGVVVFDN
ncbi:MAG: LysM domain-containing protein, partial [Pseudomonadota bacterium]